MIEMFQKSNEFYNKMIDNISNKIEELIELEKKKERLSRSPQEERPNSQALYEFKRQSRQQNGHQNDANEQNEHILSVIREATQEISQGNDESRFCSAYSQMESPAVEDRQSRESVSYQMTPYFSTQFMRTPSIYNFNAFRHEFSNRSDQSSTSPYDLSLKELSLTNFESFNTTITEDQNLMTSSTPVHQMHLSAIDMIQRPSRRLSSIARPYSPRAERQSPKRKQSMIGIQSVVGRTSLLEIQNIVDNKRRKKALTLKNI